jgi:hypothetical protein
VGRVPYELVFSFAERRAAEVPVEEIRVVIVPAACRSWAAAFAVPSLLVLALLAWLAVQLPPSRFSDAIKLVLAPSFGGLLVAGLASLRDPRRLPSFGLVHDSRIAGLAALALSLAGWVLPRATCLYVVNQTGESIELERSIDLPVTIADGQGVLWLGPSPSAPNAETEGVLVRDGRKGAEARGPALVGVRVLTFRCKSPAWESQAKILPLLRAGSRLTFEYGSGCKRKDVVAATLDGRKLMEVLDAGHGAEPGSAARSTLDGPGAPREAHADWRATVSIAAGIELPHLGDHVRFAVSQELEPRAQHLLALKGRGEVRDVELEVFGPTGGPIITSHHVGEAWLTATVTTVGADAPLGKLECGVPGAVAASVKAWLLPVNGTRLRSLLVRDGDMVASRWTAGNQDRLSAWMCLYDLKAVTTPGGAPRAPHGRPDRAELCLDEGWYPDFDWTLEFPAGRAPPVIDVVLDKERLGKLTCLDEREPKAPLRVGPVAIADGSQVSRATVRFEHTAGRPLVSTWARAEGAVRYGDWTWLCRPSEHVHAAPASIWRRGDGDRPANAEMRSIEIVPEVEASTKVHERGARPRDAAP